MRLIYGLVLSCVASWSYAKDGANLLGSEGLPKPVPVPKHVLDAVRNTWKPDDIGVLDECIEHFKLKRRDYGRFLDALPISINDDNWPDYLVRSTEKPCCGAFNGAHAIGFWLVTTQEGADHEDIGEVVFEGGVDEVVMLNSKTNGYHDFRTSYCAAGGCGIKIYKMNGREYVASECMEKRYSDGRISRSTCRK